MKIRHADYSSVIVELDLREFERMTGITIGNTFYSKKPEELTGKEFDLHELFNTLNDVIALSETKENFKSKLEDAKLTVDKIFWPIKEVLKKPNMVIK